MGNGLKRVAAACGGLTVTAGGQTAHYDAEGQRMGKSKVTPAQLDVLVAQTREPKPEPLPDSASGGMYSPDYEWQWANVRREWVPAHRWSSDPGAAAQLMQEVVDASPEGHLNCYGSGVVQEGYFCFLRIFEADSDEFSSYGAEGETSEPRARVRAWLAWKGVEAPNDGME